MGSIGAPRLHVSARWKLEDKTEVEEEAAADESSADALIGGMMDEIGEEMEEREEEAIEEFWEKAEELLKGDDGNVCDNAGVHFVSIPLVEIEEGKTGENG